MPFDAVGAVPVPHRAAGEARPFVPYRRPQRLGPDHDLAGLWDIVATLEEGWADQRGPIAPEDDDLSQRWDDDCRPEKRTQRRGLNMDALTAAVAEVLPDLTDRATVGALLAEAGHTTRIVAERRYLLSVSAIRAGIGRNVRPQRGYRFPTVYPEYVPMIARSLAWDWIKEQVARLPTEEQRREYLARWHDYLPVKTLVRLSGGSTRTMERTLKRAREAREAAARSGGNADRRRPPASEVGR